MQACLIKTWRWSSLKSTSPKKQSEAGTRQIHQQQRKCNLLSHQDAAGADGSIGENFGGQRTTVEATEAEEVVARLTEAQLPTEAQPEFKQTPAPAPSWSMKTPKAPGEKHPLHIMHEYSSSLWRLPWQLREPSQVQISHARHRSARDGKSM